MRMWFVWIFAIWHWKDYRRWLQKSPRRFRLFSSHPMHLLGDGHRIRRHTCGGDLAKGAGLCIKSEKATNEDIDLFAPQSTKALGLAHDISQKINRDKPFRYISDPPFKHGVKKRIPSVEKARRVLGFEAKTSLNEALDEMIPRVEKQVELGGI